MCTLRCRERETKKTTKLTEVSKKKNNNNKKQKSKQKQKQTIIIIKKTNLQLVKAKCPALKLHCHVGLPPIVFE